MAAPMFAGSVIPASVIFPVVTWVMRTPQSPPRSSTAPAAVAVHWALGVRCPPYSSGRRNSRSAAQKWELVIAQTVSAAPPSMSSAPRVIASPIVEHAP